MSTTTTKNLHGKAAAANDAAQARNDELAARLFEYQRRHELSDERLGKLLASSATYVSRYRSAGENPAAFTGDLFRFESAIQELLMKEELMEGDNTKLSGEGFCVPPVHAFLDFILANRQLGVGHGPAGRGKTCAARLYAANHSRSVYLHVWDWSASRDRLVTELAAVARIRRQARETLAEALVRNFRDSDRLIILDNAQRLTERSRKFLCDFYDATRTPIALIGNPEIVKQFEKNDQHFSRLGRCINVTLSEAEQAAENNRRTVLTLLENFMPVALDDKAVQARSMELLRLSNGGASRTVKNVLRLAERITRAGVPAMEAVRMAETQLAREAA